MVVPYVAGLASGVSYAAEKERKYQAYWFEASVYDVWMKKKFAMGLMEITNWICGGFITQRASR